VWITPFAFSFLAPKRDASEQRFGRFRSGALPMQRYLSYLLRLPALVVAAIVFVMIGVPLAAPAATGTTATIIGTVRDAETGAPIAGVKVNAVSPSQASSTTTDSRGFYVFNGLSADTYTLSFQLEGYQLASEAGITASQAQTVTYNASLSKALRTIARVQTRSPSNLVQPNNGSDVYNISGAQANAATGANYNSQTLNTYLGTVPGVTISGGVGFPRIRGSDTHDVGYEFDGIPIRERLFGLFTTNITDVGIGNTEVFTGGVPANAASNSGAGVINTVAKVGTYPAFGDITVGAATPDYNHYLTVEYGGQTQNRHWSYYLSYGGVRSKNVYGYGLHSYPNSIGGDISGPVIEHDIVGNFHYRPSEKDDFQFLFQNGLGDFVFDYGLPGKGEAGPLSITPCPGYSTTAPGASSSYFGSVGGTAPNSQPCPLGFAWSAIPGPANVWHHYSGIGKVQWNHNINANSFFDLRLAENFNQYIFDQPLADPNLPNLENPGQYLNVNPTCPTYPYTAGTPLQGYANGPYGTAPADNLCGYDFQSFYGDRKSHMYFLSADYTNSISPNLTFRAGAGQEYDANLLAYVARDSFNQDGTYPNRNYAYSDVPTHVPNAYASADIRVRKLLLTPGISWSRIWYGIPALLGGTRSTGIWNPTFNGTYSFSSNDVLRFSYGNASSFIGSAYIARTDPVGPKGVPVPNSAYDPGTDGASINPELVQAGDLMLEHNFSNGTSMRIGPFYNNSIGYYEAYSPIKGFLNGAPIYAPATRSSSGRHHDLGLEFALNHVDNRPQGLSFWLTSTYDNFWSTSASNLNGASPVFAPLPSYFTSRGILSRNPTNPLFTSSLVADLHSSGFHWYPEVFYNLDTFYNVGYSQNYDAKGNAVGPPALSQNHVAGAWYMVNMTFSKDITRNFTVGVTARNITDQGNAPTPCFVVDPTGCAGVNGPYSGYHNLAPGYTYQPVANYFSPYPQTFELFATMKM